MSEILADEVLPTAVFASNDHIAIGAAYAIHECGLKAPNEISLVGVNDLDVGQYVNPPLTTVRQPIREMARVGIDLLLKLLNEESPDDTQVVLSPQLVVRQSTAGV